MKKLKFTETNADEEAGPKLGFLVSGQLFFRILLDYRLYLSILAYIHLWQEPDWLIQLPDDYSPGNLPLVS